MVRRVLVLLIVFFGYQTDAQAGLTFDFDYRFDSDGFFDDPVRRAALEAAGRVVNRYVDDLSAIIPSGDNTWLSAFSPPDGSRPLPLRDLPVAQGTMQIFVAGREDLHDTLAFAVNTAPSGFGDTDWSNTVRFRGQAGAEVRPATDVGPMGGAISFSSVESEVPWHFDLMTDGLEPHEFDFVTVAMHEILHLMGFGTSTAFVDHVDRFDRFIGEEAKRVGSPTNPNLQVGGDEKHFARNTKSTWNGELQETLLAPAIFPGKRTFPTILDRAAMRDLGWVEAMPGDANLDGQFNSTDILTVFQTGLYDTGALAGWSDGDWNDNGVFDSGDLVAALQTGTFEQGARPAMNLVPEPGGVGLGIIALLMLGAHRRRRLRSPSP